MGKHDYLQKRRLFCWVKSIDNVLEKVHPKKVIIKKGRKMELFHCFDSQLFVNFIRTFFNGPEVRIQFCGFLIPNFNSVENFFALFALFWNLEATNLKGLRKGKRPFIHVFYIYIWHPFPPEHSPFSQKSCWNPCTLIPMLRADRGAASCLPRFMITNSRGASRKKNVGGKSVGIYIHIRIPWWPVMKRC